MYAVTTDFLDGDVKDILKFSEGRWEIEECFRVMKTDFETRPVFLHDDVRIKAHFLICFLNFLNLSVLLYHVFLCYEQKNSVRKIIFSNGIQPIFIIVFYLLEESN